MERTAKCLCGQFGVIVTGEPTMVNVCHCRDCQRRSGAPWTSNAYFPKENVRLDGPNKVYTRVSNAGTRINHHFCPNCGVTVGFTRETGSIRFGIPVGTFNDPSFPAPSRSFWQEARYTWSPQVSDVEHWDTQPPPPWCIATANALPLSCSAMPASWHKPDQWYWSRDVRRLGVDRSDRRTVKPMRLTQRTWDRLTSGWLCFDEQRWNFPLRYRSCRGRVMYVTVVRADIH
jgi:hypothetical protein